MVRDLFPFILRGVSGKGLTVGKVLRVGKVLGVSKELRAGEELGVGETLIVGKELGVGEELVGCEESSVIKDLLDANESLSPWGPAIKHLSILEMRMKLSDAVMVRGRKSRGRSKMNLTPLNSDTAC